MIYKFSDCISIGSSKWAVESFEVKHIIYALLNKTHGNVTHGNVAFLDDTHLIHAFSKKNILFLNFLS